MYPRMHQYCKWTRIMKENDKVVFLHTYIHVKTYMTLDTILLYQLHNKHTLGLVNFVYHDMVKKDHKIIWTYHNVIFTILWLTVLLVKKNMSTRKLECEIGKGFWKMKKMLLRITANVITGVKWHSSIVHFFSFCTKHFERAERKSFIQGKNIGACGKEKIGL